MQIDPKVEEPARKLLGHAIRGELDELAELWTALDVTQLAECMSLFSRVAGYIAIDVNGWQWPSESDIREIAQGIAALDTDYVLMEADAYDYLSRGALGFETLLDVFPDRGKIATVPLLTSASLLVAYRPDGKHWWEYLDVIESALEEAAPLSDAAFPAALLFSRRNRAQQARG
jgi:hypothetical protein